MRYNRTSKQVLISVVIAVAFVALALMTGTRRVNANTFTVSNLSDSGMGSLRQAILDANANPGADTINFQAGLTGTIQLTMGPLTINDPTLGALTMNGPGAQVLTVSGEGVSRVFSIAPGNTVTLDGLTLSNGSDFFGGSGIFNQGTLTITNSTISGNSATNGFGGGIWNQGTLTITNSTISGNSATSGTGGGIFNQGTLTITNSTISGNSTNAGGGGIANVGGGTLTITSSTISGNSAPTVNGGGIFNLNIATFKNSIIANSPSGGNCGGVAIAPVGVNFSTDNTCAGFTVVPSTGAGGLNLGPLQDNGGPTFTHALLPGSVAIDAVTACTDLSAVPAPVTTDQRGFARPKDGDGNGSALCDAGAFELQPCSVTCPANITESNDPNQCGAVVTYPAPTTTGDCFTITCSPASGSFFSAGATTVNCDASGTTANPDCTFTITVNDTQAPTITCPANITHSTDPNQCSAVVTYPTPTVSDNCPGVGTPTCTPVSGAIFPKGTTTVSCSVSDASKNTATCSFTITVNDTQPPSITCPANITHSTDPNQCSAVVTYPAPTVSDNCPGVGTPTCTPVSGSTFPKGITTVTCNVSDVSGNTASCSFTVTVNDTQPPTITCPANVTAVAAQTCPISSSATVTFPAPTVSDNCPGVTSVCTPPSGSIFPVGTTTVTCAATDTSGNTATCSFTVTVFSGCLQDDSNPANVVLFNAVTGQYRFCCGGTIFTGVGTVLVKGCILTIQHYPADRRVLIKFDGAVGAGTASLQSPPGSIRCTITDRNTRNNTCACP